ncbi:hypothetical protein KSS87_019152 [Heliosperma pusillum]|nr:hypothetical protein KSS87_019152 [Heliosperma pusillum]
MDWSPHPKVSYKRKCMINQFCRFPFDIEDSKLDLDTKISALQTAQTLIDDTSGSCFVDDNQLFICCGIIMESESRDGASTATILTSASLLRPSDGTAKLASNLKIDVYGVGGKATEGKVAGVDFHYNVATIEIHSDTPLPIPEIRLIDNVVEVGPSVPVHRDGRYSVATSNRFKLYPGDKVLALARYFEEPYDIMVASGEYSSDDCQFDCKELLKTSCKIKKNGIGGPLINFYGEVIGINFYEEAFTPFLPMNIIIKCFEDLKNNRHVLRPSLGVEVGDLHIRSLHELENFCNKFSHVRRGATIEQVLPDSPGDFAGLCSGDVIINCGGASVGSSLELTEILWGNEGKPIELIVARPSMGKQMKIFVNALDSNRRENRWPVPKPRLVISDRFKWMYRSTLD